MKKKVFLLYSVSLIVGVALIFGIDAYTTSTHQVSNTDIIVTTQPTHIQTTTL